MQINSDSNKTKNEKEEKRKQNQIEKEDTTKWAEIKEQRSTEATLARVIISWVDVTTPVIQYANTSVVLPTVRVAMQIDSVWAPMRHALPATTTSPSLPRPLPNTLHTAQAILYVLWFDSSSVNNSYYYISTNWVD